MGSEIERLKQFLGENRKDCFEQEEEGILTREGKGMVLLIDSIYEHMDWEKPLIPKRKICKMTEEENEFWEKTYKTHESKGTRGDIHELADQATKKQFLRLKDCDKIIYRNENEE